MESINLKAEEVQYLISLVLTRYHQIKKTVLNTNEEEINDSLNEELSILMELYSKIEPIIKRLNNEDSI